MLNQVFISRIQQRFSHEKRARVCLWFDPSSEFSLGSVYTISTGKTDNRLALFLLQAQCNSGSGRIIPLGNLSKGMKEGIKTPDAFLRGNLKSLGITKDLNSYDFSLQAIKSENKRDISKIPDAILTAIQWPFYDSPTKATMMSLELI